MMLSELPMNERIGVRVKAYLKDFRKGVPYIVSYKLAVVVSVKGNKAKVELEGLPASARKDRILACDELEIAV